MKIRDSVAFVTGAEPGNRFGVRAGVGRGGGAQGLRRGKRPGKHLHRWGREGAPGCDDSPRRLPLAARRAADVTLLINNAGIALWTGFLGSDSVRAARSEMETNYFGPLELARAFAPILAKNGGGAIINMLSVLSWVSVPSGGTYSASKAAAWALTNWLRTDLKKQGTQVLAVHVGPVDTDMTRQLTFPKVKPVEVVRQTLGALEAGRPEVLVDELTRTVKAGLSSDAAVYLDFDPSRRAAA